MLQWSEFYCIDKRNIAPALSGKGKRSCQLFPSVHTQNTQVRIHKWLSTDCYLILEKVSQVLISLKSEHTKYQNVYRSVALDFGTNIKILKL